jgi:GAF domain-containing protein
MAWQGHVIGALFLRTYREGPRFSEDDVAFSQVVAEVTAGALRLAHKLERLQTRDGAQDLLVANKERAALLLFLRRLLAAYSDRDRTRGADEVLAEASGEEIERLVGVALTVVTQEAGGR